MTFSRKPALFAGIADDTLLSYGVPPEWFDEVRRSNEDTLFDVAERLPQEAAEALLELAWRRLFLHVGVQPFHRVRIEAHRIITRGAGIVGHACPSVRAPAQLLP